MSPPNRSTTPSVLDAALAYARHGWQVFPVKDRAKNPLTEHGFHDASSDAETIRNWWERFPKANVGVSTGPASGLVVLDVDMHNNVDGSESLRELEGKLGALPDTVEALTGGGGRHLFFRHPGRPVKSRKVAEGVDCKADGGYVILPPSVHASGRAYQWEGMSHPEDVRVAELPAAWLDFLGDGPERRAEPLPDTIPEGARNETLMSLAGSMRRRGAGESTILAALREQNTHCVPPLPDAEVESIAASVVRYPPAATSTYGRRLVAADPDIHNTDMGNAKRLVVRHGQDLRYAYQFRSWFAWTGTHWQQDDAGEVSRRAKDTVLAMYELASQLDDPDARAALAKHAATSESAPRVAAMIDLAQSELPVQPRQLDTDLWVLNTPNGTLDLRTGELRPNRREDMITMVTAAPYDPDARLDMWNEFLSNVCDGDPDFATFLQRAVGASLTGDASGTELIFFAYGGTLTGKSTFLEAVVNTLGSYGRTADFETFLRQERGQGAKPRSDLVRLRGARFVKSIEVSEGRRLAEGLLKNLTGGDTITVRDMYAKEIEFRPQFTIWLAANDTPPARPDDNAIWRRMKRLPFSHKFSSPDPTIKAQLTSPEYAGPAILRWAVQGCLEWLQVGSLEVPEAVRASTQAYRDESDPLTEFIDERCKVVAGGKLSAKDAYRTYRCWAEDQGIRRPLAQKRFGTLFGRRFERKHERAGDFYLDVILREPL